MTTVDLKKALIYRISEIDDISFLKAFKTILDSKSDHEIVALSPEQRYQILESMKEVKQGMFVEQDELDRKVAKWLKDR